MSTSMPFVKNVSIVKRALWTPANRTLQRISERPQLARRRYRHSIIHQPARLDIYRSKSSYAIRHLSTTNDPKGAKNESPIQMPDKDVELKLADLQATITEEYKRGNFKQALKSSQDLLKQTQEHFGFTTDHPATASAMNNVGLMHKLLGNFTEARQHYVGAMRVYASVCGRDHASYAMTLHNLGNLNKSQVHFDTSLKATERLSLVEKAMEFLEEAYAIRVAELGAEHPHTIATRSAIGSTLAAQVLYQHKMVKGSNDSSKKQYVALDSKGITQQQWRAAEEHLRASLQMAIENPRGKQIQNNSQSNRKGKNKKKKGKQFKPPQKSTKDSDGVTTLTAASAAQNLAVFLKSLAMTFDEESKPRKEHIYEAKDLYEKAQAVRSQLLPHDHPDLYATKYSLAELLDVLAASAGEEDERQRHEEAATALRQEIIDTYDPPDEEEEEASETKAKPLDVVIEKTGGYQK
eukprot:CAMPEP_0116082878 /NCGR_PEP_ID=MMETSP0327-20121206/2966_1 /TAXON_ID=44447 /ORGANISM="Pseudo-nitzschia delicatissima, Strain B596" /LENGTH=464 /DNA_ID=CAMNT_0003573711 /DNA_START=63 /DNA_END=1457 /DNA_ORIENTATION=-